MCIIWNVITGFRNTNNITVITMINRRWYNDDDNNKDSHILSRPDLRKIVIIS